MSLLSHLTAEKVVESQPPLNPDEGDICDYLLIFQPVRQFGIWKIKRESNT
jgi:hypothetical protein